MKTIETQGRDGSPQPSQVSGATRRHPTRLRLKNRAFQHPAPTVADQKLRSDPFVFPSVFSVSFDSGAPASSPFGPICDCSISRLPRLSVVVKSSSAAFTLLEVLVATAVLALMMTFLFNLLGSSAKLWEIGNKKIEAAQAARVGLNIMANDLKNAFAGNMTSYTANGTAMYNIAPFMALGNSTTTTMGLGGGSVSADGSQQIAGVTLSNNASIPYNEFGYMAVFVDNANGINPMIGDRYYLVKKLDSIGDNGSGGQFYFRNSIPDNSWYGSSTVFYPIVDNCIRLKLEYYGDEDLGDENDPAYSPEWTGTWSPTNPTDRLPLGVLVTISVIDSKTAVKIAAITKDPLDGDDITAGLNAAAGTGNISSSSTINATIQRLISQGSVTMSRFIPFNSN
jgi:type II secretory pathway pseudopilin PulG